MTGSGKLDFHSIPSIAAMSVIPLTLAISLCLVFTFVLFFLREHSRQRFSSAESDALLPLADETPRRVSASPKPAKQVAHHHEHAHGEGHVCGCKTGERPPCAGCLRRDEPAAVVNG